MGGDDPGRVVQGPHGGVVLQVLHVLDVQVRDLGAEVGQDAGVEELEVEDLGVGQDVDDGVLGEGVVAAFEEDLAFSVGWEEVRDGEVFAD